MIKTSMTQLTTLTSTTGAGVNIVSAEGGISHQPVGEIWNFEDHVLRLSTQVISIWWETFSEIK